MHRKVNKRDIDLDFCGLMFYSIKTVCMKLMAVFICFTIVFNLHNEIQMWNKS